MKFVILACIAFAANICVAQNPVGIFQTNSDIGNPKVKGSTVYNSKDQSYTLKGGGYNVWFGRDEFQYAYRKLKGDFILTADVQLTGEGKDPHRKIGWMIRASDQDDAAVNSSFMTND